MFNRNGKGEMITVTVDANANDQRADRYLHKLFDVPKAVVQKWFRNKKVKRERTALAPSDRVYTGDVLLCFFHADYRRSETKTTSHTLRPDEICYEDADIVVINKSPGMLSHAAHGKEYGKNVVDRLTAYLIQKGDFVPRVQSSFSPAIANRLDRNTGGLLIGCKNYEALKTINQAIREGEIQKYYTALVCGAKPKIGLYESYWEKDERKRTVHLSDDESGKKTVTEIISVTQWGAFYLVKIALHTGRTHQIRSQMKALGSPILGDAKYGSISCQRKADMLGLQHQFLFADELIFHIDDTKHPQFQNLTVRLTLPEKYQAILEKAKGINDDTK